MVKNAMKSKAEAIIQAKETGFIEISEKTATLLLHISQLENLADVIYEELTERLEGEKELCETIFTRTAPHIAAYLEEVRKETSMIMAENLSNRNFKGL